MSFIAGFYRLIAAGHALANLIFYTSLTFLLTGAMPLCGEDLDAKPKQLEPLYEKLANIFALPSVELLKRASDAEFEKKWETAMLYFQIYLTKDQTSDTADKVRAELNNIRWRSKLYSAETEKLDKQSQALKQGRLLFELGLFDDAARLAAELATDYPEYWQSHFLAACALLRLGQYEAARQFLVEGTARMGKQEMDQAVDLMVLIDKEERKSILLKKVDLLLRESKASEAFVLYQKLTEDNPEDPKIRVSSIQLAVLAKDYASALKLLGTPLLLPDGSTREIPAKIREKLQAELKNLQRNSKETAAPKGAPIKKPSKAPTKSTTQKVNKASMSDDFLNRIKK